MRLSKLELDSYKTTLFNVKLLVNPASIVSIQRPLSKQTA